MSTLPRHIWQAFDTPWAGVHGMHIDSARHYGRHWHDTFGVGPLEHGAQTSTRGRGNVDAYAGDLITCNPGEVHDGRPLGGPSRRWRILAFEPSAMAELASMQSGPVQRLSKSLNPRSVTQNCAPHSRRCSIASTGGSRRVRPQTPSPATRRLPTPWQLLTARYTTTPPDDRVDGDMKRVRDRLADEVAEPPTLAAPGRDDGHESLSGAPAIQGRVRHAATRLAAATARGARAQADPKRSQRCASGGMQWLCRSEPPLAHFHAPVRLHAGCVATCDAAARMNLLTASACR